MEIQTRLQPNHWRLLDAPWPNNNSSSSSLFLSSAMIRHINSHPVPRFRNASHDDDGGDTSSITTLAQALHHSKRRRRVKREDISAALSKNITMILEDLLKDYDKTERPAFKKGITIFERSKLLLASCFLSLFSKCHDITLSKRLF